MNPKSVSLALVHFFSCVTLQNLQHFSTLFFKFTVFLPILSVDQEGEFQLEHDLWTGGTKSLLVILPRSQDSLYLSVICRSSFIIGCEYV